MELVLDANTVIYLVKANLHDDFLRYTKEGYQIILDTSVFEEVVEKGLQHNYPDAAVAKTYIETNKVPIVPVDITSAIHQYRDPGETSCALLTSEDKNNRICVSSDKRAIIKFENFGIPFTQLDVLFYSFMQKKEMSQEEFFSTLHKLEKVNAITPERITYFYELIKEKKEE